MTSERIRMLWKKTAPLVLGAAVLGSFGGVAVKHYLGGSCCTPGASCCHPGSPCCHGHAASGGLAQR
jgi:hypothetical protein